MLVPKYASGGYPIANGRLTPPPSVSNVVGGARRIDTPRRRRSFLTRIITQAETGRVSVRPLFAELSA